MEQLQLQAETVGKLLEKHDTDAAWSTYIQITLKKDRLGARFKELTAVKQSDDLFVALANVLSKRNCDPDGARGGQPPSLLSRACRA